MNLHVNFMTNDPVDSQIFEPNFLYKHAKKGQTTPYTNSHISATVWSCEKNEPILETKNVGLQHI